MVHGSATAHELVRGGASPKVAREVEVATAILSPAARACCSSRRAPGSTLASDHLFTRCGRGGAAGGRAGAGAFAATASAARGSRQGLRPLVSRMPHARACKLCRHQGWAIDAALPAPVAISASASAAPHLALSSGSLSSNSCSGVTSSPTASATPRHAHSGRRPSAACCASGVRVCRRGHAADSARGGARRTRRPRLPHV
jgi:hypothetical protein